MSVQDSEFLKLQVKERVQLIAAKLLEADPQLPIHLGMIHSTLIQHEELVHLLSDEEIRAIVAGQKKHTGVMGLKEVTTKSKASTNAALKRIPKASADDF